VSERPKGENRPFGFLPFFLSLVRRLFSRHHSNSNKGKGNNDANSNHTRSHASTLSATAIATSFPLEMNENEAKNEAPTCRSHNSIIHAAQHTADEKLVGRNYYFS